MQVEQIDREAAVEYWNGLADEWNSWTEISGQEQDATVQAFARHRQQARAEVVGEIVAWLRSMPDGSFVLSDPDAADYIKAKFGGREITGIEAELSDPRCPARKAKKARLEKLRRAYRDGHGYPRTSDSTWHPGDEM